MISPEIKLLFAIASGVLALTFNAQVAYGAYKGSLKPSPYTWGIWFVNDALILLCSLSLGAKNTIIVPVVYTFTGLFVVLLSLRRKSSKIHKVEILSLALSLLGWILFLGSGSKVAVFIGAVVNSIAVLPTIKNVLIDPKNESLSAWFVQVLSSFCMTISLEKFDPALLAFPLSSNLSCGLMVILLVRVKFKFAN